MGVKISGLLGLIILVADVWAIVKTVGSSTSTGGKVFWIVLILTPSLGLIGFVQWKIIPPDISFRLPCRIQLKMLQELFDMLLLKYTRNLILLGIMDSSLNEHIQIFQCVVAKDTAGLQLALSTHLGHVRDHITEGFKKLFDSRPQQMVDLFSFE